TRRSYAGASTLAASGVPTDDPLNVYISNQVIDNLVTGFRWAVPQDVPFVQGDIADQALVQATLREHGVQAIMHFAGSVVVPESVENPLKYYNNN
ncbi:GDP-mannose 4,6-dehydratase, partial [Aquabacterium sp.]|uniref:GDP-mannose 4,6-dehydratase n=1 Tax=Aquabacterium sp. TaxID=1872578 RepID=UPI0035C70AC4